MDGGPLRPDLKLSRSLSCCVCIRIQCGLACICYVYVYVNVYMNVYNIMLWNVRKVSMHVRIAISQ